MSHDGLGFVSVNRAIMLYLGIAVQNFEWLCAWMMIRFQRTLDITTVSVEKRKFTPFEIKVKRYAKILIWIYLIVPNLRNIYGFTIT